MDDSQPLMSCCVCGSIDKANSFNTCLKCLQSTIDITEGIPKKSQLYHCSKCDRYLQPPNTWLQADLESQKLLTICLKRLPGLNKVKVMDARFLYTEPHSKQLQVRLVVQKQVLEKEVLEQAFKIDFTILNQICTECQRFEAKDYWKSCVQIRQKNVDHKRTLHYLEQVILKSGISSLASDIKSIGTDGVDFFFQSEPAARKFFQFVQNRVPCRSSQSKKLISHDVHSNSYNYKYIFSIEVVPICKDSVVCLPAQLMSKYGNSLGPICICYRVSNLIHLIDPSTMKTCQLAGGDYFRYPFLPFCSVRQLRQYVVSDIEYEKEPLRAHNMEQASVWVMRSEGTDTSADGLFDPSPIHCRTHLGSWLRHGCHVAGYDLANMNFNDDHLSKIDPSRFPDVILVKRVYPNRHKKKHSRKWRLKRLLNEMPEGEGDDLDDFMDDIEDDRILRQDIAIYRQEKEVSVQADDDDDEAMSVDSAPEIDLSEMLDELHLDD